jgi:hypothetical protein
VFGAQVESAWIIYNRPKNSELTNEYAGFLMALGLNGHLPNLDTLNVHDYLSKVRLSAEKKKQLVRIKNIPRKLVQ